MSGLAARVALLSILLLAAALHLYGLATAGYNAYYAATVKSMLGGWHPFFFASFDPAGFVSVDKPPLGFWIQAASAWALGFSGFSLLLPQALAGILSVAVLYRLVSRCFGPAAGLVAALVLALTPISVAANRNNTTDGLLVLVLLMAAWAVSLAAENGRLRWLLLAAGLVGLGFNIKMLQAYMVLPAFYLVYLVTAPLAWWRRLAHLVLATGLLLAVSLAWVVAVDATPPDQRPFVGSSQNNTVMRLVLGHNAMNRLGPMADALGLRRLLAQVFPPTGPPAGPAPQGAPPVGPYPGQPAQPPPQGGQPEMPYTNQPGMAPSQPQGQPAAPNQPRPNASPQPGNDETGPPDLLRLFNRQLAGQTSWLLPLAALGLLVAAWQTGLRRPLTREHQALLLWGGWLAPQVVFFSYAGLFHRYYLEMLSPAIAALVGAGAVALWRDYRGGGARGWLLPLALVGSAAVEARILSDFPDWRRWLAPAVLGLCGLAAAVLAGCRCLPCLAAFRRHGGAAGPSAAGLLSRHLPAAACAIGFVALLIAPAAWSVTPLTGGDSGLPFAGPELLNRPRAVGPPAADRRLSDYLLTRQQGRRFLVATLNANTAAPFILSTGQAAMALGGFSGGDRILTVNQLAARVRDRQVRFFWLPAQPAQQADLTGWVTRNCRLVPPAEWQGAPAGARPANPGAEGQNQLYDCGP